MLATLFKKKTEGQNRLFVIIVSLVLVVAVLLIIGNLATAREMEPALDTTISLNKATLAASINRPNLKWRYVVGTANSPLGTAKVGSVCKAAYFPAGNKASTASMHHVASTGTANSFKFFKEPTAGSSKLIDLRGHKVCFRNYNKDDGYHTIYSRVYQIPWHGLQLKEIEITDDGSYVSADDGRATEVWRFVVGETNSVLDKASAGSPCKLAYFPNNISSGSSPGEAPPSEVAHTGTDRSFPIIETQGSAVDSEGNSASSALNLSGKKVCFRSHKNDIYGTVYSYVHQISGQAVTTTEPETVNNDSVSDVDDVAAPVAVDSTNPNSNSNSNPITATNPAANTDLPVNQPPGQTSLPDISLEVKDGYVVATNNHKAKYNQSWRYVVGGPALKKAAEGSTCKQEYFVDPRSTEPGAVKPAEVETYGLGHKVKIEHTSHLIAGVYIAVDKSLSGHNICFRDYWAWDDHKMFYSKVWRIPNVKATGGHLKKIDGRCAELQTLANNQEKPSKVALANCLGLAGSIRNDFIKSLIILNTSPGLKAEVGGIRGNYNPPRGPTLMFENNYSYLRALDVAMHEYLHKLYYEDLTSKARVTFNQGSLRLMESDNRYRAIIQAHGHIYPRDFAKLDQVFSLMRQTKINRSAFKADMSALIPKDYQQFLKDDYGIIALMLELNSLVVSDNPRLNYDQRLAFNTDDKRTIDAILDKHYYRTITVETDGVNLKTGEEFTIEEEMSFSDFIFYGLFTILSEGYPMIAMHFNKKLPADLSSNYARYFGSSQNRRELADYLSKKMAPLGLYPYNFLNN